MTVSNQTNRTSATGTNTAGQAISYSFPTNLSSDLVVKTRVTDTGVEATLTLTTDYTATVSDTGGTVTMVSAIPVTKTIHIIRDTPNTQSLDLVAGGSFDAESLEDSLDKVTKLSIENKDALSRNLRFPETDPVTSIGDMLNSIDRASKALTFDSDGKPTASVAVPAGSVTFSALGTNIAEAADAATVRNLIGTVFDVIAYGAVGDGATDDEVAIELAIAAAAVNGGVVYFPSTGNTYMMTTAITVPSNVTLTFEPGASIESDGSSTITINGPMSVGRHQIFTNFGSGDILFGKGALGAAYPEWWGAIADGVTDCTDPLNWACVAHQSVSLAIGVYMTDGWFVNGAGRKISGSSGNENSGISTLTGTVVKARGTQAYVLTTVTRDSLFEHIVFDGAYTTATVVRIWRLSIHNQFQHCTFTSTLEDDGSGSSGGKLVWDDSTDGGAEVSAQGDHITWEDCKFTSGDVTKLSAESLRITGTNALMCNINRCLFFIARIHISIGGGARITKCDFILYTRAAIQYTGSSAPLTIEECYSELQDVSFLRMTNTSIITRAPVIMRRNSLSIGGTGLILCQCQPIYLEYNHFGCNVQVERPGASTPYPRVLAIGNNFTTGFDWTGDDALAVTEIDTGLFDVDLLTFTPPTHKLNIYGGSHVGTATAYTRISESGILSHSSVVMDVDDTTPDVATSQVLISQANDNPTEITDFDNPVIGSIIMIIVGHATNPPTIADSGNFRLSAAWAPGVNDNIRLYVKADNLYHEISRSDN